MAKLGYLLCFVVFIGNKVLISSAAEFWKYVFFSLMWGNILLSKIVSNSSRQNNFSISVEEISNPNPAESATVIQWPPWVF